MQEEVCSCETCLLGMFDYCIYPIMLHACRVRGSVFKNTPIDGKLQGVLENHEELLENIDDVN